ncbi:SGNH/GDSL hydrolase family protein [Pseudomonas aegrilactucae]|uniref:SGNH/GDSL hydrolase family protein n=1 Tax=Pseudomonas aegrilactucae TaxID=2854028 RepID=A0A9Q3ACE3_9PSED|nr:SGNH/GDSL hydrolase family protein [Pseudomonas aegrilactucae]MBV6286665.1 SGNH/GDSL hydrolase family protein [Pseudomonas aegrilactucae]
MRRPHHLLALAALICLLPGCSPVAAVNAPAARPISAPQKAAPGRDANLAVLAGKLRTASRTPVTVVQFGDSHTAADLFSGEMRRLFQAQYGDGGMGFVAATPVPGTRYDNVILKTAKRQWDLVSARNQQSEQFPLGGYLSVPLAATPGVRIEAREPTAQRYRISALYQARENSSLTARGGQNATRRVMLAASNGQWRFSPLLNGIGLPVDLSLNAHPGTVLGGWYIQGQKNAGVTYSALGINGARLQVQEKWQAGWQENLKALRPDLIILAYGTNEAFDDTLDMGQYRDQLTRTVAQIRRLQPRAVIVLVGPSDSIKQRGARACSARRPQSLPQVVQIQRQVARQANVLFWDWQAYMGGECSIAQWQAQGLARGDLVHLTADGYRKSAAGLYDYLRAQLGLR